MKILTGCFQKRPKPELLTPVSMAREMSAGLEPRSPTPTPVFCDSGSSSPSSPMVYDVSLSELNEDESSAFNKSPITSTSCLPETSCSQAPGEFFEQIAVGYSFEEHANNPIMDWCQTDLLPDCDTIDLHTIFNPPHSPQTLADDLSDHLNLDSKFADLLANDF